MPKPNFLNKGKPLPPAGEQLANEPQPTNGEQLANEPLPPAGEQLANEPQPTNGEQLANEPLPPAGEKPARFLRVIAKRDGFRRAGREWHGTTLVAESEFTYVQLEQLGREPLLIVEEVVA